MDVGVFSVSFFVADDGGFVVFVGGAGAGDGAFFGEGGFSFAGFEQFLTIFYLKVKSKRTDKKLKFDVFFQKMGIKFNFR